MKKRKGLKTVLTVFVALFLTGIVALSLVSRYYYHRSLMSTFVEIYLRVTDRNSLYCVEKKCAANIEEKTVTNLQDVVAPKKKASIRSTHKAVCRSFI